MQGNTWETERFVYFPQYISWNKATPPAKVLTRVQATETEERDFDYTRVEKSVIPNPELTNSKEILWTLVRDCLY